jgi:hypothetical protein
MDLFASGDYNYDRSQSLGTPGAFVVVSSTVFLLSAPYAMICFFWLVCVFFLQRSSALPWI